MPQLIRIDDPDDPRVADYRDIQERDLVGRRGLFVAEGVVVLRSLMTSPAFTPVSFLIAEHRAPALAPLLDRAGEAPVYIAGQMVMDAVAGFPIHRGVLALGRRRDAAEASASGDLVLAAFGIGNHDNMGGLFRNAAAFGVDSVVLDERCCDPLYRKALRVSVGAALLVPWRVLGDEAAVLSGLEAEGHRMLALTPSGEEALDAIEPAPRTALLVGAEGPGLSRPVLDRCRKVRIPMAAGFDSLNVATAAAVALSRLSMRAR